MSTATAANLPRVVIDTNILISAIGFPGNQRQILVLVLAGKIESVSTNILLAELEDVVNKKFPRLKDDLIRVKRKINKKFIMVSPKKSLKIIRDEDDNRVLEAAVEGQCDYIITGDKDLLDQKKYKKIKILTAEQFLTKSLL